VWPLAMVRQAHHEGREARGVWSLAMVRQAHHEGREA
jgi:hypothetical protein